MDHEVSPMPKLVEVVSRRAFVSKSVEARVMFASSVEFGARIVSRLKNALHIPPLIVLPSVDVDASALSHRLDMIARKIIKLTISKSNAMMQ